MPWKLTVLLKTHSDSWWRFLGGQVLSIHTGYSTVSWARTAVEGSQAPCRALWLSASWRLASQPVEAPICRLLLQASLVLLGGEGE